jgi:hypothetical protein
MLKLLEVGAGQANIRRMDETLRVHFGSERLKNWSIISKFYIVLLEDVLIVATGVRRESFETRTFAAPLGNTGGAGFLRMDSDRGEARR